MSETPAAVAPVTGAVPAALLSPADERRNYRLGVANGGLYQAGESFVDTSTVLPVLLSPLTQSNALIGFATAMGDIGWMVPQIFVAPWASRRTRQLPLYRRAAVVRGGCLALLALAAWLLRGHPALLLAVFFLCYGAYSAGAGIAGVPFMEVVGRTVRPERLGAFFAQRLFLGGSLGALAGLVARQVLRLDDAGTRFAILFGLSAVACSIALALFSTIHEPATPPRPTVPTPLALLGQGLRWMRHEPMFRRLFVARASLSVWLSASPFLTLFAVNDLGGGGRAAGTLLVSRLAGYVLSNILWQRLSRSAGNRAILRVSTGTSCALLLASAALAWASPWRAGLVSARATLVALEVIAALGGAAQSGVIVAFNAALIEDAPGGQRQAFVSLMYTFLGPTMLLPVLGGFVVDRANAPFLFLLCGVVSIAGFRAASRLPRLGGRAAA